MPRRPRIALPSVPLHLIQRGRPAAMGRVLGIVIGHAVPQAGQHCLEAGRLGNRRTTRIQEMHQPRQPGQAGLSWGLPRQTGLRVGGGAPRQAQAIFTFGACCLARPDPGDLVKTH